MRALTLFLFVAVVALAGCQTLGAVVSSSPDAEEEPSARPAPPAAAAPASASLKGMTTDTLRSLWGEPNLRRTEPGAEMWQYGGTGGCTLFVYLYEGAVTHAEAIPGGADEAALAACAKASGKPPLPPGS